MAHDTYYYEFLVWVWGVDGLFTFFSCSDPDIIFAFSRSLKFLGGEVIVAAYCSCLSAWVSMGIRATHLFVAHDMVCCMGRGFDVFTEFRAVSVFCRAFVPPPGSHIYIYIYIYIYI